MLATVAYFLNCSRNEQPKCMFLSTEFKKELEEDIKSDTNGHFRDGLLALCKVCMTKLSE